MINWEDRNKKILSKLPDAIIASGEIYYKASNRFLGFGYWRPSSTDPNIWTAVSIGPNQESRLLADLNDKTNMRCITKIGWFKKISPKTSPTLDKSDFTVLGE